MSNVRKIAETWKSQPTIEGAGVHLKRVFGNHDVPKLDPFLLLDDFHSNNPDEYRAGFPWHPHRGIETITYMLHGRVEHGDSIGNEGAISAGDVQWMTAGSGIIHQEMPGQDLGLLWGFQLWANLPSTHKMMDPRYRDIKNEIIPNIEVGKGVHARVICGRIGDTIGPVQDIVTDPEYLDITVSPGATFTHTVRPGYTAFAYIIEGEGKFSPHSEEVQEKETLVLYEDGDTIEVAAYDEGVRFLYCSGRPIGETVAWYGPIVMNTDEELSQAFNEYQSGDFIKVSADS